MMPSAVTAEGISLYAMSAKNRKFALQNKKQPYMDRIRYFLNRGTCRCFKDIDIADATITDIAAQAMHAPNTGNMQLYSLIVTHNGSDIRPQLNAAHFNQPAAVNAPVLLTFCADLQRYTRWCELNAADAGVDNVQALMWAWIDASLFAQQFNTIAEMRGFGCCYLGTTTFNGMDIVEALNLPELVVPVTTLAFGVPESPVKGEDRLDVGAVLHFDTYKQAKDEQIKAAYNAKENMEANKKFVLENGKENLAQVYAEVRYPRQGNEIFSQKLVEVLARQGFNIPSLKK